MIINAVFTGMFGHGGLVGDNSTCGVKKCVTQRASSRTIVKNWLIDVVLENDGRTNDQVSSRNRCKSHPTSLRMATWGCFTVFDGCSPAAGQDAQGSGAKQRVAGDRTVDASNFCSNCFQSNVYVGILSDDRAAVVETKDEHNGIRHVKGLICCADVVKCLEGVLLNVHCQHRGHINRVAIRTKTGCRTLKHIGAVSIG